MALQPLDGPSAQDVVAVDNITVKEIKVGGTALEERKVITLQPTGKIRVFFGDGGTAPIAAVVLAKGFIHNKDVIRSYEASDKQEVYMLSDTGASVNVIVAERA